MSGEANIADQWRSHYNDILNCVKNDQYKNEVVSSFRDISAHDSISVSVSEVSSVIKTLKKGKSSGPDGLSSEAFIYASPRLHVLLALCFYSMLIHGFMPTHMIDTIIVPLVKNKNGNLSDKNNYRPIALASISSKIFEKIILSRCENIFCLLLITSLAIKALIPLICVFMC